MVELSYRGERLMNELVTVPALVGIPGFASFWRQDSGISTEVLSPLAIYHKSSGTETVSLGLEWPGASCYQCQR